MNVFLKRSIIILMVGMITLGFSAREGYGQLSESEAKANWLYTLVPYVKWLDRPYRELHICVVGQEGITPYLDTLVKTEMNKAIKAGETVDPIYVQQESIKSDFNECHMLYISLSEFNNVDNLLYRAKKKGILTVSSITDFAYRGGIVELMVEGNGLKLRINTNTAQKERMLIDSDLLGFAEVVTK